MGLGYTNGGGRGYGPRTAGRLLSPGKPFFEQEQEPGRKNVRSRSIVAYKLFIISGSFERHRRHYPPAALLHIIMI